MTHPRPAPVAARSASRGRLATPLGVAVALALAAALALGLLVAPGVAHARRHARHARGAAAATAHDLGLRWYDATADTVAAAAFKDPVTASRTWAVSWLAAARAVEHGRGAADPQAAFAQALHDTLAAQVPSRRSELDAALASTLSAVPDGRSRRAGVAVGRRAAARVLAAREGDGLDTASIEVPFAPPSSDPGVWQPTPPAYASATRAGQGNARPFVLRAADRFDPGPPPGLGSRRYRRDLEEVRTYGAQGGSARTPEQTDVALFWFPGLNPFYGAVLRDVLAGTDHGLAWQARLVAVFHAVTTDAQIAVYNAKFSYVFWRPVTAIRRDAVDPDPGWTPLSVTPTYPDWPSGHGGYAGAAQAVLTAFVGPRAPAPIALTSSNDPGATRTYTDWATMTREIVDARVWEGVHFRFSDVAGARLGRDVGRWGLRHLGRLGL